MLALSPRCTLAEVEAAARRMGCELKVSSTGPAYKVELLWAAGAQLPAPRVQMLGYNDDEPPPPTLLGSSNGFTQPGGATHLEDIETRKYTGFWARRRESGARRYAAAQSLYPGVLVSTAVACWILENGLFGNTRGELLCIRDDERQHRTLVRYYRRLGFKPLREIGSDLRSIGDRVVWGGDGTLMEVDFDAYARRMTRAIREMQPKES